jgi:hypothetical protein
LHRANDARFCFPFALFTARSIVCAHRRKIGGNKSHNFTRFTSAKNRFMRTHSPRAASRHEIRPVKPLPVPPPAPSPHPELNLPLIFQPSLN